MSVHRLLELLNNRKISFSAVRVGRGASGEEEGRSPDRYRRMGFATC